MTLSKDCLDGGVHFSKVKPGAPGGTPKEDGQEVMIARLAVSPGLYRTFIQASPWTVSEVQEPDGPRRSYHVTMVFEQLEMAARHIVSFTPDVGVIEPDELRRAVYEAARRIAVWAQEDGAMPSQPSVDPE